jgi:hypothetical protein
LQLALAGPDVIWRRIAVFLAGMWSPTTFERRRLYAILQVFAVDDAYSFIYY